MQFALFNKDGEFWERKQLTTESHDLSLQNTYSV